MIAGVFFEPDEIAISRARNELFILFLDLWQSFSFIFYHFLISAERRIKI